MKDSSSWLTPKQAATILGCTARHINNCIVKGKLSATREDGRYYIDKSEFYRVFPEAHKKEQERNPDNKRIEQEKIKIENEMLKQIAEIKDKEIEFLRKQLETFNMKESKLLDTIQSHTRLLEHRGSSKKSWTDLFKKRDSHK
jgi:hypothetical protein